MPSAGIVRGASASSKRRRGDSARTHPSIAASTSPSCSTTWQPHALSSRAIRSSYLPRASRSERRLEPKPLERAVQVHAEDVETLEEQKETERDHDRAAPDLDHPIVVPQPAKRRHRAREEGRGEDERDGKAERVHAEQRRALERRVGRSGEDEDGGENRPDARCSADGERPAEEDARPASPGLLEQAGSDEALGPGQQAHEREPEHDEDEPRDPRWIPLHRMLGSIWERYKRPFLIAETSHFGVGRARWIREIGAEVYQALQIGIPVGGVCLYPILDRYDWENRNHWHNSGLWDLEPTENGKLKRVLNAKYGTALTEAQQLLAPFAV